MDIDREALKQRFCIVSPAFLAQASISAAVSGMRKYADTVVVVDDGSTDRTAAMAEEAGAVVIRHERNLGKGEALNTGFRYAREHGFEFLVTLDSNGGHDPADIPIFINAYLRTGIPVLVGNRMPHAALMPPVKRLANIITSRFLSRRMRQYLPDTLCGFRLLKCDVLPFISARAGRYAAEPEILLRVSNRGIRMDNVPINVLPPVAKQHFHPFLDTARFFIMLYRNWNL